MQFNVKNCIKWLCEKECIVGAKMENLLMQIWLSCRQSHEKVEIWTHSRAAAMLLTDNLHIAYSSWVLPVICTEGYNVQMPFLCMVVQICAEFIYQHRLFPVPVEEEKV